MILCIGTTPTIARAMIFDHVQINEANRATEVIEYASGKSVNVARVVHTLGKPVMAAGFLGGERGRLLLEDLDRVGIKHAFIEVRAPTRLCITFVDRLAGTATELIEESIRVEEEGWKRLDSQLEQLRAEASVVVCSGSLPPGGSVDFYARQVAGKRPGQDVIIDGRGAVIHEAFKHGGFILKLNLTELAATVGVDVIASEAELNSAMNKATPRGGSIVVTLGAHGVVSWDGSRFWTVGIPKVKAVSAIGSGDAFAGGMAVGLVENRSWPDILKLAAACGVANALTPLAGHVRLEDVRRLEGQILVRDGLHFPVD